jgi:hypothetical protein
MKDIFGENAYNHELKEPNLSAEEIRRIRESRLFPLRQSPAVTEALQEVDREIEARRRMLKERAWWDSI